MQRGDTVYPSGATDLLEKHVPPQWNVSRRLRRVCSSSALAYQSSYLLEAMRDGGIVAEAKGSAVRPELNEADAQRDADRGGGGWL